MKVKRPKSFSDRLVKAGYFVGVFAATFAIGFLSASHFMPVSKSQAEEAGPRYANIATSGKVDLSLDSTPGGVAKVGKDTLTVDTNAQTEYRLYISTAKDAGDGLYLEGDSTQYVSPSTGKLASPTKLAVNTWGFAQSRATNEDEIKTYTDKDADHETGKAAFVGVPEYGSEKLLYVNTDPTAAATNSLDVYYGMSASVALPAGSYSNTVVYTAIVDTATSESSNLTITPNSQTGPAAGNPVTITTGFYPGDFALDNLGDIDVYIGTGHCTDVTPSLAANGSLTLSCLTPKGRGELDVKVFLRKFDKKYVLAKGYTYTAPPSIEDFSCANINIGDTVWVNDRRDEDDSYASTYSYYPITKLADGRCWFAEDLDIKLNFRRDSLNNADLKSDIVRGGAFSLPTSTTDGWCATSSAECDDSAQVSVPDRNIAARASSTDMNAATKYNWYAATAGSGTYARTSGDAGESICPAGWRLPTKNDFTALYNAYGSAAALLASSGNFTLTGQRVGENITDEDTGGYYWSATTGGVGTAYALKLTSSTAEISPTENYRGLAVRCVNLVDTIQDFTEPAGVLIGDTKAVLDTRDNHIYHVGKLKDNRWWMVDNLELGYTDKEMTLTSADSNVLTDFTLPKMSDAMLDGTWCADDTAECFNTVKFTDHDKGNWNHAPEGYYYNFHTVTAGTGVYDMPNQIAESDICPKGWRLPISGNEDNNDFALLTLSYGGPGIGDETGNTAAVEALSAHPTPRMVTTGSYGGDNIYGLDDGTVNYISSRYGWGNVIMTMYMRASDGNINTKALSWGHGGFVARCIRKDS